MTTPPHLDDYRRRRAQRQADRQAFKTQREHGLRLRKEAKLRHLAARAAAAKAAHAAEVPAAAEPAHAAATDAPTQSNEHGSNGPTPPPSRRLTEATRIVPNPSARDGQETFDPGPPVDAILDVPCDAESFDDCAYDDLKEEYPCDQEAC